MSENELAQLRFQQAYNSLVERLESIETEVYIAKKLLAEMRGLHHKCLETTTTTGVENAERRTNHTA